MNLASTLHRSDNIESKKFCSELINVSKMPDRNQLKNRELRRATQPCSKLVDLFKKSRPDDLIIPDDILTGNMQEVLTKVFINMNP